MRQFLLLFMGLVTLTGFLFVADIGKATSQNPQVVAESTMPAMGEPTSKSLKEFRAALLKSGEQAVKSGELSRLDLMRLRLATMSPKMLATAHQFAAEQCLSDGLCASYGAINWDQLLAFIKELIPLILELIKLFSYAPQRSQFLVYSGYESTPIAVGYHWSNDLTLAA